MNYIKGYSEFLQLKPFPIREPIRNVLLNGLSILDDIRGNEKCLLQPRVQFIYIHHVFKDEEDKFEMLLAYLSKSHQFISYSQAIEKILHRNIDRPYICFSVDDGFKNNLKIAEILNKYDAKACFFINPEIVGNTSYSEVRNYCKEKLGTPPIEFMNWADIEFLLKSGHEIGSHTMEHSNVAMAKSGEFEEDCRKTYEILMKNCGVAKHFAFPFGRYFHFTQKAFQTVFNAGYYSCEQPKEDAILILIKN